MKMLLLICAGCFTLMALTAIGLFVAHYINWCKDVKACQFSPYDERWGKMKGKKKIAITIFLALALVGTFAWLHDYQKSFVMCQKCGEWTDPKRDAQRVDKGWYLCGRCWVKGMEATEKEFGCEMSQERMRRIKGL